MTEKKTNSERTVTVTADITIKEKYELMAKTSQKRVTDAVRLAIRHYLDCSMEV